MSTASGEIVVYETQDGEIRVDVRLEQESVWLTQRQISDLFDTSTDNIGLHLKNIFNEGELDESATAEDSSVVQMEGKRRVTRTIKHYNLDAIISVGYRVNSKRGTQFRIWATQILRDHLVKGYSVNQRRLEELQQTVRLVATMAKHRDLSGDEATALLRMVGEYSRALDLLDDYDHQRVPAPRAGSQTRYALTYQEAIDIVARLRERFGSSALFGQEKDESLHSSLQAIMQTFGGQDLYSSLEEKAAHLLYFLVKNHSFVDGNKRIAAALFLWFLERNSVLTNATGTRLISDAALVAMTLMIAESRPEEKNVLVRIVMHLLCQHDPL
ncbi:MAG TPA: cytochrome C biogenesis protein CycH [Nitrospiraceae bacterium]|nr:cytochrome C biogenesis protein CycH [Nitrospiraceae bacterium]